MFIQNQQRNQRANSVHNKQYS